MLTHENSGASRVACEIINNTFLSLDGFAGLRQQMAGSSYTAEQFAAELARIADREILAASGPDFPVDPVIGDNDPWSMDSDDMF